MRLALPTTLLAPLATSFLLATTALAHGPTPQKIDQSITIAAKPDAVWAVVGDFAGVSKWHPDVATSTGTGGNASGGRRTVTLKNGGTLDEGLDEWDAGKRSYSYRLGEADLKALPVSSYSASLTVTPEGDGSKVEWIGRFYRGDTGNEPPEDLSDAAGKEAMNLYFGNGLKGLKARLEGKATQ
ncbi:SRPBCC family protein [Methylobacterium sp. 77]|uniref:SRPBCC family protein n=1 Tax=Methylobacterium sp. 77 TaxID=1101192 RepID=UPI00037F63F6|nr:SRPBCC family protein [Methylobacterium sp. 77]